MERCVDPRGVEANEGAPCAARESCCPHGSEGSVAALLRPLSPFRAVVIRSVRGLPGLDRASVGRCRRPTPLASATGRVLGRRINRIDSSSGRGARHRASTTSDSGVGVKTKRRHSLDIFVYVRRARRPTRRHVDDSPDPAGAVHARRRGASAMCRSKPESPPMADRRRGRRSRGRRPTRARSAKKVAEATSPNAVNEKRGRHRRTTDRKRGARGRSRVGDIGGPHASAARRAAGLLERGARSTVRQLERMPRRIRGDKDVAARVGDRDLSVSAVQRWTVSSSLLASGLRTFGRQFSDGRSSSCLPPARRTFGSALSFGHVPLSFGASRTALTDKSRQPVIVSAARTPIGKFLGGLAPLTAPELGAVAIREAVKRAGVDPQAIEEVIMGNVIQGGVGQAPARQAALKAGFPPTRLGAHDQQGLRLRASRR